MSNNWKPTSENINNLPEHIRKYIHDLETNCDPAGMVRENILVKDMIKNLNIKLQKLEDNLLELTKYIANDIEIDMNLVEIMKELDIWRGNIGL